MRVSSLRRPTHASGFTLVELLAVILIISILMFFLLPKIPEAIDQARTTACKKNMQEIYSGFLIYETKHKDLPKQSGAKFIASLIADGVWNNTEDSATRLSCPAVKANSLTGLTSDDPTQWYSHIESVDGTCTAYAGRDMKQFPLRKFPDGNGKEILVADDNDPEMNHRTTTVVVYDSGAVGTFELKELHAQGLITEDVETLVVGPDSPIEALRKVSLD